MTPEQIKELKVAALKALKARGSSGLWDFTLAASPSNILSLIAQVEALAVPHVYLVYAYYQYDGTTPVRVFAQEADAIAFAAACNTYESTRPAYKSDAEAAWFAAHPSPTAKGCDSFEVESVPFGLPTIPAIPGTKEASS